MHKSRIEQEGSFVRESRERTHDTFRVLVDRGLEQPGASTYGQSWTRLEFSFCSLYRWSLCTKGISRVLLFPLALPIMHDEEARGARSPSHISACLFPCSRTSVHLFSLFSFPFSSKRASHTAGRKSRNRPAGNPPLACCPMDLVPPKTKGSARSIGVFAMSLSRVARVFAYTFMHNIIHTLGCGSL